MSVDGNVIDNQIAGVSTFQDEVRLDLVNRIGIGQVVGISYYDSSEYDNNYISDEARNSAASFTDLSLENKSTQDITPPEFVSAETSVDGTQIILEYNENMNVDNVDIERFGVYIEDELVAISGISSVENKVFLDLTQTAGSTQFVKVNYDDPTPTDDPVGALEDVDGNDSPSFLIFRYSTILLKLHQLLIPSASLRIARSQGLMTYLKSQLAQILQTKSIISKFS